VAPLMEPTAPQQQQPQEPSHAPSRPCFRL